MVAETFPVLSASSFDLGSFTDDLNLGKSQGWEGRAHQDLTKCNETGLLSLHPSPWHERSREGLAGSYLPPPCFTAHSKANPSPTHLQRDFHGGEAHLEAIPAGTGASGFWPLLIAQIHESKQQPMSG